MRIFAVLLIAMGVLFSCKDKDTSVSEDANLFGKELSNIELTEMSNLYVKVNEEGEIAPIKLKAKVTSVCQMKGCWMTIASDDQPEKSFHVNFEDYGFFVPKDISGREVILEGKAFKEVTSVDELRHYAEDEGKSEAEIDSITAPVEKYKFTATGVRLLD